LVLSNELSNIDEIKQLKGKLNEAEAEIKRVRGMRMCVIIIGENQKVNDDIKKAKGTH